jgi:hypothetical protein
MLVSIFICVTTFLVVGIFNEKRGEKAFYYSLGLMERPEAFIFFIAMFLFPSWFLVLAVTFSVLVLWTALSRMCEFICNQ